MNKKIIVSFFTLLFFSLSIVSQPIKVACVGNSITFGAGVENREVNNYPSQLGRALGGNYEVMNFGVSARTALRNVDLPYIATDSYKNALAFAPDIVLIKLGTNDTKGLYQNVIEQYKEDYRFLLSQFREKNQNARLIILSPVRAYTGRTNAINDSILCNNIIPRLKEIAYEDKVELIDLYSIFSPEHDAAIVPDKIHPNQLGASLMVERIKEVIVLPKMKSGENRLKNGSITNRDPFNFHGYQGENFSFKGVSCKVVYPYTSAQKGKPWVIRARFWGHEPQLDRALLELGYTITYCDVADLFGSPVAEKRWGGFYKMMIKEGYDKRVVLEGMSRGGLIIFNWASNNIEKVAAIYGDAPVMDFKSWPMGLGSSSGSKGDTDKLLKAYSFKDIEQAKAYKHNPIDRVAKLAKKRKDGTVIPIVIVCGDADVVVPISENCSIFEERMSRLDAPILMYHKPTVGHHPHSLPNPKFLLEFIQKAVISSKYTH